MFKRRKSPAEWPPRQVLSQLRASYTSDPDLLDVRAATVLHLDPDLVPKDSEDPEFLAFCFGFEEEDNLYLWMDGTVSALVKQVVGAGSVVEADSAAREWVGETALEFPFEFLPGAYRGAFWAALRGVEQESDPSWFAWILPAENGLHPVRDFPPRSKPTKITPVPGEVSFVLLPSHAVEALRRVEPAR